VYVGETNQNKLDLADVARRQLDHLGPAGMKAKRDETNEVFLERGHYHFVLPTRAMREKFIGRVELYCHESVRARRMKGRKL
jgi:hypothetical protein